MEVLRGGGGRRARYEAFEEVCGKNGGTKIAVAHNRNDQAETVLFHLVRGSGLSGLSGIRPVRGNIIRPLLCLTRGGDRRPSSERKPSLPNRATNLETDYARNRIRLNILPLLREELNPRACEHLAETAERLALAEDYLAGRPGKQRKGWRAGKRTAVRAFFWTGKDFCPGAGGSESVYSAVLSEGGF